MPVELVRVTTRDGHRLDGAISVPAAGCQPLSTIDACLLLHGVGGNFYSGNLFEQLETRLLNAGLVVLRVNTRGHDWVSVCWTSTGALRQGATYEVVDECRHDVAAWVGWLQQRGYSRIALLGHSLGAIKAIYSQAQAPDPAVEAVIACSAPRLSCSAFLNSESQPRFFESLSTAREHVEQGRRDALFQASFPFPILATAAGYLDKYGPEERYNILRFVERVPCPLLVTYGQLELERGGIPFAGMPEAVLAKRGDQQRMQVTTIPAADHLYTGAHQALADCIQQWLRSHFPREPSPPGPGSGIASG